MCARTIRPSRFLEHRWHDYLKLYSVLLLLLLSSVIALADLNPWDGVQGVNITEDRDYSNSAIPVDLNGDGHIDVVVGNQHGPNKYYLNNGTNDPFSGVMGKNLGPESYHNIGMAVGDVDNDGDPDVVAAGYLSGVHLLYFNNGTADPFDGVSGVRIATDTGSSHAAALGDLNGDGSLDLVLSTYAIGDINRIYMNNGTNDPFRLGGVPTPGIPLSNDRNNTIQFFLADVDNDGDLDVFACNPGSSYTSKLFLNNGSSAPFDGVVGIEFPGGFGADSVAVEDFDRDGWRDLVIGSNAAGNEGLSFYRNGLGDTTPYLYDPTSPTIIAHFSQGAYFLEAGDVDKDGDIDLVVGHDNFPMELYLNNGTSDPWLHVAAATITTGVEPTTQVTLADMNSDGWQDLVVAEYAVWTGYYWDVRPNHLYLANPSSIPPIEFCHLEDDFEDGAIDTSMWVATGLAGGIHASDWTYSFEEDGDGAGDGYIQARVWGSQYANTMWAEASLQTAYDFNDGKEWRISFAWDSSLNGTIPHYDVYAVQITDRPYSGPYGNLYWVWNGLPEGTVNLWFTGSDSYMVNRAQPYPPFARQDCSIVIEPGGVARFYQSANGTGVPYSEVLLDPTRAWHLRFFLDDATSSGYDRGDNWFRLYNFSAEANCAVFRVDKDNTSGIEDGLTWETAFDTVQEGIDAAASYGGGEVWVAEGTYISATSPVVTLYANVKLYGGFEGVESSLGQRDWTAYVTTIDGENSRRCVVGANNTVLDGFTMIRGATSGSWPANCGGGVLAEDCSMAINNCRFYLNTTTGYHAGGAAIASFGAVVTVTDCLFENNTASDAPGGGGGAGIECVNGSFVTATGCTFRGNYASGGSGIYVENADCDVRRCIFEGNVAWGYGGAMNVYGTCTVKINDSVFLRNSGIHGGAFIDYNACSTSMTNCLFVNNNASITGGAFRTVGTFTMTNCTLADNTAPAGGGWMFVNTGKTATAVNCIFWGNSPNGIGIEGGGSPTVTYSDVQGGFPGIGNINVDPEFLDTAADDYHLQSTSPCIDTGTFVSAPDHDLEGTQRPIGAGWDMGAYEGGHEPPNGPPIAVCCDVTVPADAGCEADASIDCGSYDPDGDPITVEQIPAGPYNLGVTQVTLRVTDEQGAVDECTANVTVVDETPPTLTCPPDVTVAADANCEGEIPLAQVQPSDNCGLVTVEQVPLAGTKVGLGSHPVTVTATGESGNSSSCVFVFTVVDVTPPTMICPADQEVPAEANCEGEIPVALAQVTDECGPVTLEQTPAAGTKVGLGVHPVTVTATDGSGNSSTCVFVVSVVDVTPPELTCPADVNLSADAGCEALVPDLASLAVATDACDEPTIIQTPAAGTTISLGVTSVAITATDATGNTSSCVVNVTVLDTTPPEITCPGDQVVAALDCEYHVEFLEASAVDNCDPNPVVTCTPSSGSVLGPGTHTVTCTATDASGNTSSCSFTVTVLEPLRIAFVSPLEDDNVRDDIETDLDAVNKFKVGQTIPIKVKLFDCAGNDVTATVGPSMTLRLDATEREHLGATSTVVNDLPEDYNGLGDTESTMVLVGGHFQYNLITSGFTQGTINNATRFFRVHVTAVQNTDPGVVVGEEDVSLESK